MRCTMLMVALGFAFTAVASAGEDQVTTLVDRDVQMPEIVRLDAVDLEKKQIERTRVILRPISETAERTEVVNGVVRKVPVTVTRIVEESQRQRKDFKKLRAMTPSGKDIPPDVLKQAIGDGKLVVLSTDPSGNISKDVAKLFKDDAILILGIPEVEFDPYRVWPRAPASSPPTLVPSTFPPPGEDGPKLGEPGFDPNQIHPAGRINTPPSLAPPPRGE